MAELPSAARLRGLFAEQFEALAADSFEFGDLLRAVVPKLTVYLVRSIDGGPPLPRARAVLALDGILPDNARPPELSVLLRREVTLDLFEPNQRERIRVAAAELAATGLPQREIAAALDPPATQCAVNHALRIHRLLEAAGLAEPYQFLAAPPTDYAKLHRHRHPRYRFEPLPGHTPFDPGR